MKVIILAGGKGSRISEITKKIPKPMIKIKSKPIIEHIINFYSAQGFNEFIIPIGYKGAFIKKYFKKFYLSKGFFILNKKRVKIKFVSTGLKTMTGGRLKSIKKFIDKNENNFMFTYGDGLANVNLKKLLKFHLKKKKIATLTAVRPISRYGVLNLKGSNVLEFKEKKSISSGWINGGFFVFNKKVFNFLKNKKSILEKEPLETITKRKQLNAFKHHGFWHSIDTIRDKEYLESKINKKIRDFPWEKIND